MDRLAREDAGVIIMINAESDLSGRSVEENLEDVFGERIKQSQPGSEQIQFQQVGVGSQILRDLGVQKMRLMGAPIKYAGLAGFDLEVVETVAAER